MSKNIIKETDLPTIKVLIPGTEEYAMLRWAVDLCIDAQMPFDVLYNKPYFQQFLHRHSAEIMREINRNLAFDKHEREIDHLHGRHHLNSIFDQLEDNEEITGKTEFARIKLQDASGMTEFPRKRSFTEIEFFLQDLQIRNITDIIKAIKKRLRQEHLYDNNNNTNDYWIWLSISSRQKLHISIEHDTQKNPDGFNGFYFELSGDNALIIKIISTRGYFDNNISEAIQIIVNKKDNDWGRNDDFDYV